jgi:hypothetical protein
MTLLEMRTKLAWELINNPNFVDADFRLRRSKRCCNQVADHAMGTAPPHAK